MILLVEFFLLEFIDFHLSFDDSPCSLTANSDLLGVKIENRFRRIYWNHWLTDDEQSNLIIAGCHCQLAFKKLLQKIVSISKRHRTDNQPGKHCWEIDANHSRCLWVLSNSLQLLKWVNHSREKSSSSSRKKNLFRLFKINKKVDEFLEMIKMPALHWMLKGFCYLFLCETNVKERKLTLSL